MKKRMTCNIPALVAPPISVARGRLKFVFISHLIILFTLFGFGACVGTIEDSKIKQTLSVPTDPPPIGFDGIYSASAVANDKVDVAFFPAPGDAEDLVYMINYDGLTSAVTVPAINLRPDYRGLLIHTVTGLQTNRTYNFEVQVKNIKTTAKSNAEGQMPAKTFGNITANFLGIQNVKTMPGLAGINSIKVEWAEAEKQGSTFVPKDIDANKYVVTVINGDVLTPGDMHNDAFVEPLRKVVYVAPDKINTVIGGLAADTTFFVSVRTIHHGFTLYGSDLNYKKEINSKYLTIKTLKAGLSNIDFDVASLNVTLAPGVQGLTAMTAQWVDAVGAFDHYRVYYTSASNSIDGYTTPDIVCDGQETNDPNYYCKEVSFTTTNTTLTGLDPNFEYAVAVGVCQSLNCEVSNRILSNTKIIETTPQAALYAGVVDIKVAKNIDKLDEFYLIVQPPDLGTGIMDGVIVKYHDPILGPIELNNPDPGVPNTSPLNVLSFNYQTATELVIVGINPFSVDSYCFSAVPYTYESSVVVKHEANEVIRCKLPALEAPDATEFAGANGCNSSFGSKSIYLDWSVPTTGIFSHYEVFLRDAAQPFDFGQAIAGNPSYTRALASSSFLEYTFEGLTQGQNYRLGVITYVNINGTIVRSDFNDNIQECVAN